MRGICFKESMFNAVINGRKTVTRRMADRYKVGEILYLKEPYFVNENGSIDYKFDNKVKHEKWENKLFMPERYARHFIRIIDKRQEKLQEITEEECFKEGIVMEYLDFNIFCTPEIELSKITELLDLYRNGVDGESYFTPKGAFAALIDRINGIGTWDKNPVVTRYEFELLK